MLQGFEDKSAYALCTFAYCGGVDEEPAVFAGRTEGTIVEARQRGEGPSFGWDPIFEPKGFAETYAEMDKEVKNGISHRRKALELLKVYLGKTLAK